MYGICANHKPYRAEQDKWSLSGDLSACPGISSTRMKKQIGSPRIGFSDGQLQPHRPAGRWTIRVPWIRTATAPLTNICCSQAHEVKGTKPRSARGRNPMKHRRADELLSISADSLFVKILKNQSQTTNCED